MSKSRKFTPGAKSMSSRMIHYNSVYYMLKTMKEKAINDPLSPDFNYSTNISTNYSKNYSNNYSVLQEQEDIVCSCYDNVVKKFAPDSQGTSGNISNNMRIAQSIRIPRSGKPQFGNFYLGEPLTLNYLGRMEGQPGGGGMPPRNRF